MQVTEDKKDRIVAAVTVASVVLIVIFIAVIIYQMVDMILIKNREKELQEGIDYYTEQIENGKADLDYLKSEEYLKEYLLKNGYNWEVSDY